MNVYACQMGGGENEVISVHLTLQGAKDFIEKRYGIFGGWMTSNSHGKTWELAGYLISEQKLRP